MMKDNSTLMYPTLSSCSVAATSPWSSGGQIYLTRSCIDAARMAVPKAYDFDLERSIIEKDANKEKMTKKELKGLSKNPTSSKFSERGTPEDQGKGISSVVGSMFKREGGERDRKLFSVFSPSSKTESSPQQETIKEERTQSATTPVRAQEQAATYSPPVADATLVPTPVAVLPPPTKQIAKASAFAERNAEASHKGQIKEAPGAEQIAVAQRTEQVTETPRVDSSVRAVRGTVTGAKEVSSDKNAKIEKMKNITNADETVCTELLEKNGYNLVKAVDAFIEMKDEKTKNKKDGPMIPRILRCSC